MTISEMLDNLDVEYFLNREGIDYKVTRGSRGMQLNVRECPVCGNSKWKVYLNQENGLGNCFHGDCEAKFSKYSFIKSVLNLSDRDTVKYIGTALEEQGFIAVQRKVYEKPNIEDLILPNSYKLPKDGKNIDYLIERNISNETTKLFGLRFCEHGKFVSKGFDSSERSQSYDNRIIIPIYDLNGKLVSFQGRDITGTSDRKYLFPSGFASTGSVLYNGHNAYGAVEVCVGEGVFDVMAIYQAFQDDLTLCNVGVVGSFGKHLSHGGDDSQFAKFVELKKAGLKRITIMWDGEKRATKDAVDTALLLRKAGFEVRVALLPKDKDPNEVAPEVVRQAYKKAIPINETTAVKLKLKLV